MKPPPALHCPGPNTQAPWSQWVSGVKPAGGPKRGLPVWYWRLWYAHHCPSRAVHAAAPGFPAVDAAAFIMIYATSHHALVDRAQLKAGETVLVLGAAGASGHGRHPDRQGPGCRVIAAASSDESARCAPPSVRMPPSTTARKTCAGHQDPDGWQGPDVIYDPSGRLCRTGFPPPSPGGAVSGGGLCIGPDSSTALQPRAAQGAHRSWACSGGEFAKREPKANAAMMAELAQWYGQGKIKPVIDRTMPMAQLPQAYAHMGSYGVMGKLVMVN